MVFEYNVIIDFPLTKSYLADRLAKYNVRRSCAKLGNHRPTWSLRKFRVRNFNMLRT